MRKTLLMMSLFLAALTMNAQEDVLKKYSAMGDVSTISVTQGMLNAIPADQLNLPIVGNMLEKIESMKILTSNKAKAAKKMYKTLPDELRHHGFDTKIKTNQAGKDIQIYQSETDSRRYVIIVYEKPKTTVISLRGKFDESDF